MQPAIDCQFFDLSYLGLITVSGADANKFLQGQCTNDIRQLIPNLSQLGSMCNHQGRMLAIFRLISHNDVFHLQLPHAIIPSVLEHLHKYRLRAQLEIHDASEQIAAIGLAGNNVAELLEQWQLNVYPEVILMRLPESVLRLQILVPKPQLTALKQQLAEFGAIKQHADMWNFLDIQAGIPTLYPETIDAFIPQMVNLQLLGGVSFNKGCYTGQEVVARVEHLGNLKRRMLRAEVKTQSRPQPGLELYSATCDSGQGAGKIVDACLSRDGVYVVLAVVDIETAQQGVVKIGADDGTQLQFLNLS